MSKINFKPDFFVVGFQKSATSTLHNIFKESNLISLPLYKETHFFSQKEIFDNLTKKILKLSKEIQCNAKLLSKFYPLMESLFFHALTDVLPLDMKEKVQLEPLLLQQESPQDH